MLQIAELLAGLEAESRSLAAAISQEKGSPTGALSTLVAQQNKADAALVLVEADFKRLEARIIDEADVQACCAWQRLCLSGLGTDKLTGCRSL